MPPSSDQETYQTSIAGTKKQSQKQASGVQTLSKKERKNGVAKDGAGATAAMKSNSKMLSDSPNAGSNTGPSPRAIPSDDKSASASTNGTSITSPLLDALSSNAFTNLSNAQNTNEWARNVPAFSSSPGNLITLSDSPPTFPSSYTEDRNTLAGWQQRERGVSNGHLSSTSPPVPRRRPLSFQMDGQQVFEDQSSQKLPYMYRRSSMYSQQSQRYATNPPLPHHAQAHFYGAPEPSFGFSPRPTGLRPGAKGYHCGFDNLMVCGIDSQKQYDTVVVSGYEGGLDVYGVSRNGFDKVFSLDSLRGGVYCAKILPSFGFGGELPLIAVVIHGPAWHPNESTGGEYTGQPASEPASAPRNESVRNSPRGLSSSPQDNLPGITHYQTTVEIYSLSSKKHVATLLSVPRVPLMAPLASVRATIPLPVGDLTILADSGNILVSSGTTGEVWIFDQPTTEDNAQEFRCVGKIWTTVKRTAAREPSSPPHFSDADLGIGERGASSAPSRIPLLSLKGRWLAYSPPPSNSQVSSLRAAVPGLTTTIRVPGLNTYTPPQQPTENCTIDMAQEERLLSWVAREVTQSFLKNIKVMGGKGKQVFNDYWSPPSGTPSSGGAGGMSPGWNGPNQLPPEVPNSFPPTHGEGVQGNSQHADPAMISIVDLKKLGLQRNSHSSGSPNPLATFKAPLGCSFISFAPNGLALFTASSKGDVQFVWDLMRVQHTKSSVLQTRHPSSLQGLHVRQIAVFTRMTVARIVDVIWTAPHGDRIAMVTERNTVHFLDLPASSFVWPPLRRRARVAAPKTSTHADSGETSSTAVSLASNAASSAIKGVWNMAQPFMRPRADTASSRAGFSTASVTAGAGISTKALASGISKSFGAASETIGHFRKSGENILRLPQSSVAPTNGCIKWLASRHRDSLAALVEGVVKIYTVKQRKSASDRHRFSIGSRPTDYHLPSIPDYRLAPLIIGPLDLDDELDLSDRGVEDPLWKLPGASAVKVDATHGTESSIPQAEIESNAPYQPFHTDRRVALHVYSDSRVQPSSSPSVSVLLVGQQVSNPAPQHTPQVIDNSVAWAFGGPIHTVKLDVGPAQVDNEDFGSSEDHIALPLSAMERVTTKISEADEENEQIVVTTRRRKGVPHGSLDATDEEGFFEDDCEVLDFASQRV